MCPAMIECFKEKVLTKPELDIHYPLPNANHMSLYIQSSKEIYLQIKNHNLPKSHYLAFCACLHRP
jgi:hypothetical protein